jgi:hypothetical protein
MLSTQSNESSLDKISILTANSNLHNIPNTATLHLNPSCSWSNTSKSSSEELSDCAYDVDSFADVNYADDSDGDSGYSNEDFPVIERRNTVIERTKSEEDVRNRRETLVGLECHCDGDCMCQLCELRQHSESMDAPSSEGSEDNTPVIDQSDEATECDGSLSSLVHTPTSETYPDHISRSNSKSDPDPITGSEKSEHVSCEDGDCTDLNQFNPDNSPAGQVMFAEDSLAPDPDTARAKDSSETDPDTSGDEDWDFPFWTEGAICINLDDEDTKL